MIGWIFNRMLALLMTLVSAAPEADIVTSLPGYGDLPTTHYSGYLELDDAMMHYWLQTAEAPLDPATAPTIFWINGGPGASGVLGLMTELGQIQTMPSPGGDRKEGQDGVPPLYHNTYGWSKLGNLLTIEQPKGVGFSYCKTTPCTNTDESTANETYLSLVQFFDKFPEYASNQLYLTGESYAGTYLPMLLDQIDKNGGLPPIGGIAIGNGCWGSGCFYGVEESEIDAHTFYGHNMITDALYNNIYDACGDSFSTSTCGGVQGDACSKNLSSMCDQAGEGQFNTYNVFDTCYPGATLVEIRDKLKPKTVHVSDWQQSMHTHPQLYEKDDTNPMHRGHSRQLNDYSCGGESNSSKWLASDAVQAALHVTQSGSMRYEKTVGDLRDVYADLIPKYKFLIYSGSVDACVPTWGSEKWTSELGYDVVDAWHPWMSTSASPGSSSSVIGGYAVKYATNDFTFITVHGAGHEVPRYKPAFAFTMLDKFIKGEDF